METLLQGGLLILWGPACVWCPLEPQNWSLVTTHSQVWDGFWHKGPFQEALQKKMKKENILFFTSSLDKKTKCFHSRENTRSINMMQLLNEST